MSRTAWKNEGARILQDNGWEITVRNGGHLQAECPDEHPEDDGQHCRIIMSATPSDRRAWRNDIARARRRHPHLGSSRIQTKEKRPMSIQPSESTLEHYRTLNAYLASHLDEPFNQKLLREAGIPQETVSAVMMRALQMAELSNRLANGGFTTSSQLQKHYDEIVQFAGGGTLYKTQSPVTGALVGWYVFDTSASYDGEGNYRCNKFPVVIKDKIVFPPNPPVEWAATGDPTVFRPVDPADVVFMDDTEQTIPEPAAASVAAPAPVTVDVVPSGVEVLDFPVAYIMAKFNGGGVDTPDQLVLKVEGETLLVTVERRTVS